MRKGRRTGLTRASAIPADERNPVLSDQASTTPDVYGRGRVPAASDHSTAFRPFLKSKPFGLGGGKLCLPVCQRVGCLPELDRFAGIKFRI